MPTTAELNKHFKDVAEAAAKEARRLKDEVARREAEIEREGHVITKPQAHEQLEDLKQEAARAEQRRVVEAERYRKRMEMQDKKNRS